MNVRETNARPRLLLLQGDNRKLLTVSEHRRPTWTALYVWYINNNMRKNIVMMNSKMRQQQPQHTQSN